MTSSDVTGVGINEIRNVGGFGAKIQTASILLHSHSSKNWSPDGWPGVHAMGPIFGVVS